MSDLPEGAVAIAAAVRSGRIKAETVARNALDAAARRNLELNCFTDITAERALREAAAVDAAVAAGRDPGPLAGVPYAVKNLFDIEGIVTLAGSKINRDNKPAAGDAALVRRLRSAGAILVGATAMDEYAYGFTTENTHYGPTRNPHDTARSAGGSSGGSGAALAARLVGCALGSDTNGSIRVPAGFDGIFGLKPTYGRLSRAGVYPFVDSLDHVGPFALDVTDLATVYDALEGCDRADPTSAMRSAEPAIPELDRGLGNLRIAVAGGHFAQGGQKEAHEAVAIAAAAIGATRAAVLPEAARARAAAFLITACEGANLHLPDLKRRARDFDPNGRDRLLAGALIPASWYIQAQRFRRWFRDRACEVFREADILLAPATPCPAPLIGQMTMMLNGAEVPMRPHLGIFTQPISFIGLPVVTVPVFQPGRLPLGVQIIAAPWRETDALRVARVLEKEGIAVAHKPPG